MTNITQPKVILMDGTNSVQSYVEVQHKKHSVLGIKPEFTSLFDTIQLVLRIRAVADPGNIKGLSNHCEYIDIIYPEFPFWKKDQKRSSFCISSSLSMDSLKGFLNAPNGELLLTRLVYKVMVQMFSHIQGMSGEPFDKMSEGLDYCTFKFMEAIKKEHTFIETVSPESINKVTNFMESLDIDEIVTQKYLH